MLRRFAAQTVLLIQFIRVCFNCENKERKRLFLDDGNRLEVLHQRLNKTRRRKISIIKLRIKIIDTVSNSSSLRQRVAPCSVRVSSRPCSVSYTASKYRLEVGRGRLRAGRCRSRLNPPRTLSSVSVAAAVV